MLLEDDGEVAGMFKWFDSLFRDYDHVIEIRLIVIEAKLIDAKEGIFLYYVDMPDHLVNNTTIEEWLHIIEIAVTIDWILLVLLYDFHLISGGVICEIELSELLGCDGLVLGLSCLTEDDEGIYLIELCLTK